MNVDWTKPIEWLYSGTAYSAVFVRTLNGNVRFRWLIVANVEGSDIVLSADKDGSVLSTSGCSAGIVRNIQPPPPKTHRLWLNLYRPGGCVVNYSGHGSELLARLAVDERGNCITRAFPVDIPEGYGLDNPSTSNRKTNDG